MHPKLCSSQTWAGMWGVTGQEGAQAGRKAGCCSKVGDCSALWVWMLGSGVCMRFSGSPILVPQKDASVVESCSLAGSVWLMPHPDLSMAVRILICCCFFGHFGSHSLYFH